MPKILLVASPGADCDTATSALSQLHSTSIVSAKDGIEALDLQSTEQPDVIVMDLNLTRMNGLEFVVTLQRQRIEAPVILIASPDNAEATLEALRLGAASYVARERLDSDLVPTVTRVLDAAASTHDRDRVCGSLVSASYVYEFETDPHLLIAAAREITRPMTSVWSWRKGEVLRIHTALEEALLNAVYHGNLELSTRLRAADIEQYYELARRRSVEYPHIIRKVRVAANFTTDAVSFEVSDDGPGFDHAVVTADAGNLVAQPFGRGIVLMKSAMDSVTFNETGNTVRLSRRRRNEAESLV